MSDPTDAVSDAATPEWGRVGTDGTVYVRTRDGERVVGQWPGGDPEEALALFRRRFDALALEVDLLERRVRDRRLTLGDATAGVKRIRGLVYGGQAVGDLDSLGNRLDALDAVIGAWRDERKAERAQQLETARARKEQLAAEADTISLGNDWRAGADRLRELLEEWKTLPRLERSVDDALWRRFSTARTTYTRRRKQHFAQVNQQRGEARAVKEQLVAEAESIADSTQWGPTAAGFRDLMRRWKAAGRAAKGVEDQLWARFSAAQDRFFRARDAVNARQEQEYAANAERKDALLAEAEALLPISDARSARAAFRSIAERWDRAGKVPKAKVKQMESRFRTVEQAVRSAEDHRWQHSNPEARARAEATVAQLESLIADLEARLSKARAGGDPAGVREAEEALNARRSWLAQAQRTLDEFKPASP